MRRAARAAALIGALCCASTSAWAQDAQPSPERIKAAAEEFDRGRRSFLAKEFEQAALHFENAYRDAPSASTLRLAIRARRDAKQIARAATLAAIAQQRFPDDTATMQAANETLDSVGPQLQEYAVDCNVECAIAADGRVVSQSDALRHRIFLDPGAHELGVSFGEGRSTAKKIDARKGGKDSLSFEAPPAPKVEPPPVPVDPNRDRPPSPPPTPAEKPFGPLVFFVGAGLTVAAGGATLWSGLDTESAPGTDAVRRECAGKDESCPAYQDGQDKELRTNILIGSTIGLGVITGVIGLFFTQWSTPKVSTTGSGFVMRF